MKNSITESSRVEEGKVIAERLNGLAASICCLALVGAYLTRGKLFLESSNDYKKQSIQIILLEKVIANRLNGYDVFYV